MIMNSFKVGLSRSRKFLPHFRRWGECPHKTKENKIFPSLVWKNTFIFCLAFENKNFKFYFLEKQADFKKRLYLAVIFRINDYL